MPRITSKGQITIPQEIRNKFSFLPGMEVEFISDGSKVFIVKSQNENAFMKWLGRGKRSSRKRIDNRVNQLRGRIDE